MSFFQILHYAKHVIVVFFETWSKKLDCVIIKNVKFLILQFAKIVVLFEIWIKN
jgi:hypothetical protein